MKEQKVICRCAENHCFLEEDAARVKQNYAAAQAQAGGRDAVKQVRVLVQQLEEARLQDKSEWLESLEVSGSIQVQCRKQEGELS